MSKVFWIVVLVIVAVAVYQAFSSLKDGIKFESLAGVLKFPSAINRPATTTLSLSAGNKKYEYNQPAAPAPAGPSKPAIVPPPGFTADQLSPYYGQVDISSVSAGTFSNPGRFSLRSSYSPSGPVNITGWHLKSNNSDLIVPRAAADYDPGGASPDSDVVLGKGEYANFYNAINPIGRNFKLNRCMGYLNATYKFNPVLPNNCPAPYVRSEIISFSGSCQSLILSLSGCSMPNVQQLNNLYTYNDQLCKSYVLDRTGYSGCYRHHRSDSDFFSGEWRIWLSGGMNFDPKHDHFLLLDRNGLLVDEYYY
jgi:hypothetical protein